MIRHKWKLKSGECSDGLITEYLECPRCGCRKTRYTKYPERVRTLRYTNQKGVRGSKRPEFK